MVIFLIRHEATHDVLVSFHADLLLRVLFDGWNFAVSGGMLHTLLLAELCFLLSTNLSCLLAFYIPDSPYSAIPLRFSTCVAVVY